jgi:hypothetical protein
MIGTIAENLKGFLLDPVESFRKSRDDAPGAVFLYLGVLLLINAVFSAMVAVAVGFGSSDALEAMVGGMPAPVGVFFLVLVGGFILTLICAAWVHLWAYLFGARRGIMQTLTAIVYAGTPGQILGWIPLIGFIAGLWSMVLVVLGIRELQELSTGKAILAVAIAVIIPLAVIILAIMFFMIGSSSMTVVPVSPADI